MFMSTPICLNIFSLQYFVTSSDMAEATPTTIQMVSSNEPSIDTSALSGGKIRIVNSEEAIMPRKIITINQQQYVVSQGSRKFQIHS